MKFDYLTTLALKFRLYRMMRERQKEQSLEDAGWYKPQIQKDLIQAAKENDETDLLVKEKYPIFI